MNSVELILLILAYTLLILTIFVSFICYKKNLQKWETIAFGISLLLLILSLTVASFAEKVTPYKTINIFVLLSMIIVGLTTPLSVMSERQHRIPSYYKKIHYIISILLFVLTSISYFIDKVNHIENFVLFFLGISVVLSMLLIRMTKPQKSIAHREKTERVFAIIFLILVPISLLTNSITVKTGHHLKIGFTLPLIFILLAADKLFDDLSRLSLLKNKIIPIEKHFKNYSLSEREKEIAKLLVDGKTYKQISEDLFISLPTVKTHTSNIYKKCGVKSRHQLTTLMMN